MKKFDSPFGEVELTNERVEHVLKFHPEVRRYLKRIKQVLAKPSIISQSKFDPRVQICYSPISQRKHLVVVVKTNQRNFILTIYLTSKIKH